MAIPTTIPAKGNNKTGVNMAPQIVHIIEEGGWTVFRNMPLIFAVGLPIGLAKQAQ
jgi:phosphotransferase system  glucose/maltose/N-acetylglucosamine-specific IIC component